MSKEPLKIWIAYEIDSGYPEDPELTINIHRIFTKEEQSRDFKDTLYEAHKMLTAYATSEDKERQKEARKKLVEVYKYESYSDAPHNVKIQEAEVPV